MSLDPEVENLISLIRMDAQYLVEKIEERKNEYIFVFSQSRDRTPFHDVFKNKYEKMDPSTLVRLSPDVLIAVETLYQLVDKVKWYMLYTQDMPNQVEETLLYKIPRLKSALDEVFLAADIMMGKTEFLEFKQGEEPDSEELGPSGLE